MKKQELLDQFIATAVAQSILGQAPNYQTGSSDRLMSTEPR